MREGLFIVVGFPNKLPRSLECSGVGPALE